MEPLLEQFDAQVRYGRPYGNNRDLRLSGRISAEEKALIDGLKARVNQTKSHWAQVSEVDVIVQAVKFALGQDAVNEILKTTKQC